MLLDGVAEDPAEHLHVVAESLVQLVTRQLPRGQGLPPYLTRPSHQGWADREQATTAVTQSQGTHTG